MSARPWLHGEDPPTRLVAAIEALIEAKIEAAFTEQDKSDNNLGYIIRGHAIVEERRAALCAEVDTFVDAFLKRIQ